VARIGGLVGHDELVNAGQDIHARRRRYGELDYASLVGVM
jgi:hypothetical protein